MDQRKKRGGRYRQRGGNITYRPKKVQPKKKPITPKTTVQTETKHHTEKKSTSLKPRTPKSQQHKEEQDKETKEISEEEEEEEEASSSSDNEDTDDKSEEDVPIEKNACAVIIGFESDLGRSLVHRFAKEGYGIVLISADKEQNDIQSEIDQKYGFESLCKTCNVSDAEDCRRVYQEIDDYPPGMGPIEVLCYNASSGGDENEFMHFNPDKLALETKGLTIWAQLVLPDMVRNKNATSILISGSETGPATFGIGSLSKSIAHRYNDKGVQVTHFLFDADGGYDMDQIADTYCLMHKQPKNHWTDEIDLNTDPVKQFVVDHWMKLKKKDIEEITDRNLRIYFNEGLAEIVMNGEEMNSNEDTKEEEDVDEEEEAMEEENEDKQVDDDVRDEEVADIVSGNDNNESTEVSEIVEPTREQRKHHLVKSFVGMFEEKLSDFFDELVPSAPTSETTMGDLRIDEPHNPYMDDDLLKACVEEYSFEKNNAFVKKHDTRKQ